MENDLSIFYRVSELFNDDERVIAHATTHFFHLGVSPKVIYVDLLECNLSHWVDYLEELLFIDREVLTLFIERKCQELDFLGGNEWSGTDFDVLSKRAWKLHEGL